MAANGPTELKDNESNEEVSFDIVHSPAGWFIPSPRSGIVKFTEGKTAGLQPQAPATQTTEEAPEPERKKTKRRHSGL